MKLSPKADFVPVKRTIQIAVDLVSKHFGASAGVAITSSKLKQIS